MNIAYIHHKEADSATGWNFITQRNIASLVETESLTLALKMKFK
jgi:hypothetical protein